jgi:hypothetical protein
MAEEHDHLSRMTTGDEPSRLQAAAHQRRQLCRNNAYDTGCRRTGSRPRAETYQRRTAQRSLLSLPYVPTRSRGTDGGTFTVENASFARTSGQPAIYRLSQEAERSFRLKCGMQLALRDEPDHLDVTLASLDTPEAVRPSYHIWTPGSTSLMICRATGRTAGRYSY